MKNRINEHRVAKINNFGVADHPIADVNCSLDNGNIRLNIDTGIKQRFDLSIGDTIKLIKNLQELY